MKRLCSVLWVMVLVSIASCGSARWNARPNRKLTLVSAPAGFGKTTLVSGWVAACEKLDPKVRTAWLSLD